MLNITKSNEILNALLNTGSLTNSTVQSTINAVSFGTSPYLALFKVLPDGNGGNYEEVMTPTATSEYHRVLLTNKGAYNKQITVYALNEDVGGVIAERAGILPAEFIEQMTGTNPGSDIPYEAGTYALVVQEDGIFAFVSSVEGRFSVKDYIDKNGSNITDTFVSWDGNTDGLPSVLDMFYKVSDNTYVPNEIVYRYANKSSDGTVTLDADYLTTEGVITDLADAFY